MSRIALTGASGFVGRNLIDRRPDVEIHALGRTPVPGTQFHCVDLFDGDARRRALETIAPSHLCHLAWIGLEEPDRYSSPRNAAWADMTVELVEEANSVGVRRVLLAGSCIEHGNAGGVLHEDGPFAPDTAYGEAKLDSNRRVLELCDDDFSVVVARLFFLYGPHEPIARLVPSVVTALLEGREVALSHGRQRRDYLHAHDAADALWALLRSEERGAFNVGFGTSVEVRQVAELIGDLLGRRELLLFGARPEGPDVAAEITADTQRLRTALGWVPAIPLDEGLALTVDWWRSRLAKGTTT